jgi:RNA polymerase sigma-54 factor
MSTRARLNVSTTQRMALNTGLVAAINTLRADALGLTRYLEEAAAANPALLLNPSPVSYEWLPRWTHAFSAANQPDVLVSAGPSLLAHVSAFVAKTFPAGQDRAIAMALTEALEPSGWLGSSVAVIAQDLGCKLADAMRVLGVLQRIEPRGLFAQSLSECLRLQATEQGIADAIMLTMLDNLDLLAAADFARLARVARTSEAEVMARFRLIRGLDPKPGAGFTQAAATMREPDLMAFKKDDAWHITLNRSALPGLALAEDRKLGKRAEAKALIALVNARNATLLRVGQEIMLRQWHALERGLIALLPMRMAEIADATGLHESTISRVVAGAAIDTPQGTWWLRDLFSRDLGNGIAAAALRQRLSAIVSAEDAAKPLSDDAIAAALSDGGPAIARRTVAKYRGLLHIPPAHARKLKTTRKRPPKG